MGLHAFKIDINNTGKNRPDLPVPAVALPSPYLSSRRGLWANYFLRKIVKNTNFRKIIKSNPMPFLKGELQGIDIRRPPPPGLVPGGYGVPDHIRPRTLGLGTTTPAAGPAVFRPPVFCRPSSFFSFSLFFGLFSGFVLGPFDDMLGSL